MWWFPSAQPWQPPNREETDSQTGSETLLVSQRKDLNCWCLPSGNSLVAVSVPLKSSQKECEEASSVWCMVSLSRFLLSVSFSCFTCQTKYSNTNNKKRETGSHSRYLAFSFNQLASSTVSPRYLKPWQQQVSVPIWDLGLHLLLMQQMSGLLIPSQSGKPCLFTAVLIIGTKSRQYPHKLFLYCHIWKKILTRGSSFFRFCPQHRMICLVWQRWVS